LKIPSGYLESEFDVYKSTLDLLVEKGQIMNVFDKAKMLLHIARWVLTWNKRDIDYLPDNLPIEKFITARNAAKLIKDGASVGSCGMAGNARCSILFWGVKENFEETGHPKDLTWTTVGAQGGRGKAPGTIEEIGIPGIIRLYISGHTETEKAQLKLADQKHLELHTMPQGEQAFLWRAMGEGKESIQSTTGVGTFLDPRVGNGTAVSPNAKHNFVEAKGEMLEYRLPKLDIAMFNAPYADIEGNIYFKHASCITENVDCAAAARANGGKVIAAVSSIIEKNEAEISMPAEAVDFIVVNPRNEQTGSIPQIKYWPMFTAGGNVDMADAVAKLKFANNTLKITPTRGPVENALARLASLLFTEEADRGNIINIGVGMPEEVGRLLYESGLYKDLTFTSETGVYGGLPTPGVFFGAAINPKEINNSSWMFDIYKKKLNIACLGSLQTDSEGNVNVSKRGERMLDYVGPGGFPNIVDGAKTIIFVGSWMAHAKMSIKDGKLSIDKAGKPKFVEKVDQITFSGKQGLKMGKQVFYVTNVGIFKLTERGLELQQVMPGIDIQKDIIDGCPAKIVLPEDGKVSTVPDFIVTGENFKLHWDD